MFSFILNKTIYCFILISPFQNINNSQFFFKKYINCSLDSRYQIIKTQQEILSVNEFKNHQRKSIFMSVKTRKRIFSFL